MKDIKAHEERVQGIAKLLKSRREQEEKKEGKKNSLDVDAREPPAKAGTKRKNDSSRTIGRDGKKPKIEFLRDERGFYKGTAKPSKKMVPPSPHIKSPMPKSDGTKPKRKGIVTTAKPPLPKEQKTTKVEPGTSKSSVSCNPPTECEKSSTTCATPGEEPQCTQKSSSNVNSQGNSQNNKKRKSDGTHEEGANKRSKVQRNPPAGLYNFNNACFSNVVIQLMSSVPAIVSHYVEKADSIPDAIKKCGLTDKELLEMGRKRTSTRGKEDKSKAKREGVRQVLEQHKDKVVLGPHLGSVLKLMVTANKRRQVTPFVFQQACGLLCDGDKNQEGADRVPLDGEEQSDADQMLQELFNNLHAEAVSEGIEAGGRSKVNKLFQAEISKEFNCKSCNHSHTNSENPMLHSIMLEKRKEALSLEECLDNWHKSELIKEYPCPDCKATESIMVRESFTELPPYLVIKLNRCDDAGKKVLTRVTFPEEVINFARWSAPDLKNRYEATCVIEHLGRSRGNGHYVATRKVDEKWWYIDDDQVSELSLQDLQTKHQNCYIVLLQKIE